MVYIVIDRGDLEEGLTLKDIASSICVENSEGVGYYQLTADDKISSSQKLLLYDHDKLVSDEPEEIRKLCSLPLIGDTSVLPSNVPAAYRLFIQSTSATREVKEGMSVAFYLEDDNIDVSDDGIRSLKRTERGGELDGPDEKFLKNAEYAINFDSIHDDYWDAIERRAGFGCLFRFCDEHVPAEVQKEALWNFSRLLACEWTKIYDVEIEPMSNRYQPDDTRYLHRLCAEGSLKETRDISGVRVNTSTAVKLVSLVPVIERGSTRFVAVSIGNEWAAIVGSLANHPFVYTTELIYDNSHGSSREPLIAVPLNFDTEKDDKKILVRLALEHMICTFRKHCNQHRKTTYRRSGGLGKG